MEINKEQIDCLLGITDAKEIHNKLIDWFVKDLKSLKYPVIVEISKGAKRIKIDSSDPNFDKPIVSLHKEY